MRYLAQQGELESDWSENFLEILPHELRHREVERILREEKPRMKQARRLRLTYDEALPALREAFQSAKAEERGKAYWQFVRCAALNRRMADALTTLERTGNEQDPIRSVVFQALAAVSPALLEDEHAPLLESLLQAALEAPDRSRMTGHSMQSLLFGLLVQHSSRGSGALVKLCTEFLRKLGTHAGGLYFPNLASILPKSTESVLVDTL